MPDIIGTDYQAYIPSLSEDADITQALSDYHLGPDGFPQNGIEAFLTSLEDGKLDKSLLSNKAELVVGGDTDPETLVAPAVVGYVLETDPTTSSGLAWKQSAREQEQIAHIMGVY